MIIIKALIPAVEMSGPMGWLLNVYKDIMFVLRELDAAPPHSQWSRLVMQQKKIPFTQNAFSP